MKKNLLIGLFSMLSLFAYAQFTVNSDTIIGEYAYGVVDVSVCNIRLKPDFDSNMETQALLGQPVKILQHNSWYRIQTQDEYISWVHRMQIVPMTRNEFNQWNAAQKVIVTVLYGFVYQQPSSSSQPVSDVVSGNLLKYIGIRGNYYYVGYPDGRKGYLAMSSAMPEKKWFATRMPDASHFIASAKTMMGIPYLWGGTSPKGVDCSGFVNTVALMNGLILPRNASELILVGERLKVTDDFSDLQPGDLVFFGHKATTERPERVSHVGIYLGEKKFIHSLGMVHISSFDPNDSAYDAYDLKRFIGATRFLNHINEPGITKIQLNKFYQQL
jgi:hypothetical protein